jgi:hypothetical protein
MHIKRTTAAVAGAVALLAGALTGCSALPGGKVVIAILGLRVNGRLATLTTRFTPQLPAGSGSETTPFTLNGSKFLSPTLIDSVNLKRYVVVQDSTGDPVPSEGTLQNNQPGTLTHTFAAPPESVKRVHVQLGTWPIFRNVPVQR